MNPRSDDFDAFPSSPDPKNTLQIPPTAPSPPSPLTSLQESTSSSSRSTASRDAPLPPIGALAPRQALHHSIQPQRVPENFYYGLPSRPKPLASTRPAADFATRTEDNHPVGKHIYPLPVDHSINPLWDTTIVPYTMALINSILPRGPACLDAVRIGFSEGEAVATIWIGLPEGAVPYETAAMMAENIKAFCVAKGANLFEVELRATIVQKLTKLIDVESLLPDVYKVADSFCHTLGTPISTAKYPDAIGTGGLLVRLPEHDRLFMLTAHHVVEKDGNARLEPSDEVDTTTVRLHTISSFRRLREMLNAKIAVQANQVKEFNQKIAVAEERGRNPTVLQQSCHLIKGHFEILNGWSKRMDDEFGDVDLRTFGRTFAYPRIAFNVDASDSDRNQVTGYSEDWALVETDIRHGTEPINVLNLLDTDDIVFAQLRPDRLPALRMDGESSGLLKVDGSLTQADLSEGIFTVLKRGTTSDLTLGLTNSVHSYWRKDTAWSKELAVINFERGLLSSPFSQKGDSGAIVIDREGRVCGMLHAGCGIVDEVVRGFDGLKHRAGMDITYVTPWWWLKERMRVFGLEPIVA